MAPYEVIDLTISSDNDDDADIDILHSRICKGVSLDPNAASTKSENPSYDLNGSGNQTRRSFQNNMLPSQVLEASILSSNSKGSNFSRRKRPASEAFQRVGIRSSSSIADLLAQVVEPQVDQGTPEKRYIWRKHERISSRLSLLDNSKPGSDADRPLLARSSGLREKMDVPAHVWGRRASGKRTKFANTTTARSIVSPGSSSELHSPVAWKEVIEDSEDESLCTGPTHTITPFIGPSSTSYSSLSTPSVSSGSGRLESPSRIVQVAQNVDPVSRAPNLSLWSPRAKSKPSIALVSQDRAQTCKAVKSFNYPLAQSANTPPTSFPLTQSTREPSSKLKPRKFDITTLKSRISRPYSEAEVIMIGYLSEKIGLSWNEIDRKMARGHNTCATKHTKQPHGLKYEAVKVKLHWQERVRAIDALLQTQDLDMEQLVGFLQRYIETATLPKEAAEVFDQFQDSSSAVVPHPNKPHQQSQPGIAHITNQLNSRGHSLSRTGLESHQHDYLNQADETDLVSNRLRPAARVTEGQVDVKDKCYYDRSGKTPTSPDSIFKSDEDGGPLLQQTGHLSVTNEDLFDVEDDEYASDAYILRKKPYLSFKERKALSGAIKLTPNLAEPWISTAVHEGFRFSETRAIDQAVQDICPELVVHGSLLAALNSATKAQISAIASCASTNVALLSRTRRSIISFLNDVASGKSQMQPERLRIGHKTKTIEQRQIMHSTRHLLQREFGYKSSHRKIRQRLYDSMTITRSFTGASGDVGSVAWSPSGRHFAAGAVCLVDMNSMQYNRPNNLLLGHIEQNILYELPSHHRQRRKPKQGVNSTHSMHSSQDSRLFETVSMVDFSHDESFLFSVGYDNHLRVFSTNGHPTQDIFHYDHGAKIDLLNVHRRNPVLATGCMDIHNGIKIFRYSDAGLELMRGYTSARAKQLPHKKIIPSALKWGFHSSVSNYILAGFSTSVGDDAIHTSASGELCLWDVEHDKVMQTIPAAGNTFDCTWSPASGRFASAVAAYGLNLNRGTKSLVRVYDPLRGLDGVRWSTHGLQLECPALDINDTVFNQYDQNYIAAGATDGTVYVWDIRRPDDILHRLGHGKAVMELDENYPREQADTGVRFCSWGHDRAHLYTGSSDGVVKLWDIYRAPEDTHRNDAATFNSGIMSGAFNKDFSQLVIGEVNGSINLLGLGKPSALPVKDIQNFTLRSFEPPEPEKKTEPEDCGVSAARSLLRHRKIEVHPLGGYPVHQVVQGRNYDGPFDKAPDAPLLRQRAQEFQRRMWTSSQSKCDTRLCQAAGRNFGKEPIDSERWKDRIPQAMRDAMGHDEVNKAAITMIKCTHCGAPARVREEDLSQAAFPRCERCSFGCLRCGNSIKISASVDFVCCQICGLHWDICVLGYAIQQSGGRREEDASKQKAERYRAEPEGGGLEDIADLLHLVEEYHHSLWEDGPRQEH